MIKRHWNAWQIEPSFVGTPQSHAALAGTHRRMGGAIDTSQYTIGNHICHNDHHLHHGDSPRM